MWKHPITDKSGVPLNIQTGIDGNQTLVTDGIRALNAQWQAVSLTTAVTGQHLVDARPHGSIMLTDLIVILSKKVTAATISFSFENGGNKATLFKFDAATDSFQFSHAFQGGLRGWKDADLLVTTNQATTVGILVGYVHIAPAQTKTYGVWNAER